VTLAQAAPAPQPEQLSTANRLESFAQRLMDALIASNFVVVESMFTPAGRFCVERLGIDLQVHDACLHLASLHQDVGKHEHTDVRRLYLDDAFVDQHVARWHDSSGRPVAAEVCTVVRVEPPNASHNDYLVISFEEYLGEARVIQAEPTLTGADLVRSNVQRHVDSEFVNDIDGILATISSYDVFFPQVASSPEGFKIVSAMDAAGARDFYVGTRQLYNAIRSTHLNAVYTPWYAFRASVGELERVRGDVDVATSGPDRIEVPSATIFPVASDGIVGEISWVETSVADLFAGRSNDVEAGAARKARLRRNVDRFTEFQQAWPAGDAAWLSDLIDEPCCWITRTIRPSTDARHYCEMTTRRDVIDAYASASSTIASVEVLNRLVEPWYVFAEYCVRFVTPSNGPADESNVRRIAALYPMSDDGRIAGEFSYAIDGPTFLLG
jgi:hypothetical protein